MGEDSCETPFKGPEGFPEENEETVGSEAWMQDGRIDGRDLRWATQ